MLSHLYLFRICQSSMSDHLGFLICLIKISIVEKLIFEKDLNFSRTVHKSFFEPCAQSCM